MGDGYVWYSFGSDKSGPALAKALGFASGKKTPNPTQHSVIVGWGCKPGKGYDAGVFRREVAARRLRLLNSVDATEANRNKLAALQRLQKAEVPVPGFFPRAKGAGTKPILDAVKEGQLRFPLLGLTASNRGEPEFFYTAEDLSRAGEKVEYFRSFLPGTEYRVHIFRDTILAVQRKELADDPLEACAEDLHTKLNRRVEKDAQTRGILAPALITKEALKIILGEVADAIAVGPGHVERSVKKGWKLVDVSAAQTPAAVKECAVRALDALELDLGAVSVTIDSDERRPAPAVTAVTTAPALSSAHLSAYVQAIKEFARSRPEEKKPATAKSSGKKNAPRELTARLVEKVSELPEREAKRLLAFLSEE